MNKHIYPLPEITFICGRNCFVSFFIIPFFIFPFPLSLCRQFFLISFHIQLFFIRSLPECEVKLSQLSEQDIFKQFRRSYMDGFSMWENLFIHILTSPTEHTSIHTFIRLYVLFLMRDLFDICFSLLYTRCIVVILFSHFFKDNTQNIPSAP